MRDRVFFASWNLILDTKLRGILHEKDNFLCKVNTLITFDKLIPLDLDYRMFSSM